MEANFVQVLVVAGVALFGSGGAAWAGVKTSLNGMRERQERTEKDVRHIRADITAIKVELGRQGAVQEEQRV